MKKDNTYDISADVVRIVAALAVVGVHVTDALIILPNHFGGISWWWANFINSFSRIAVPFFIMLSGYLFLNPKKELNTNNFYRKRTNKVVIPFIFWFIFYLFWNQYHNRQYFTVISLTYNLFTLSIGPLYFLIIIFFLYLITPNIRTYVRNITIRKLIEIISTLFIIAFTSITITYFFPILRIIDNIFTLPFFFLSYYLYGLLIRKIKISSKKLYILVTIFIGATILTTVLAYLNTKYRVIWVNNFGQYFHESFSPLIIIMSLSSFTIIIKLKNFFQNKIAKSTHFLKRLSADTFIIYLIHPLILDLVDTYLHMNIHEMHNALWLRVSVKIFVVFIISSLVAEIFRLTKSSFHLKEVFQRRKILL